jgi:hypothetical protein
VNSPFKQNSELTQCARHIIHYSESHPCQFFSWLTPKTMYFNRLETVSFFHLFTCEGDIEYTGCSNTNTDALRLEYCPDFHLAQISLKNGASEHVFYCDGRLTGHTQGLSKNAQLQATVNCSCLCSLPFLILISELNVEPLRYGEKQNAIARQLDFCYIFLVTNKFRARNIHY